MDLLDFRVAKTIRMAHTMTVAQTMKVTETMRVSQTMQMAETMRVSQTMRAECQEGCQPVACVYLTSCSPCSQTLQPETDSLGSSGPLREHWSRLSNK